MWLLSSPQGEGRLALFGAGLIGTALLHAAHEQGARPQERIPWSWAPRTAMGEAQLAHAQQLLSGTDRLDLIWSAGRAGFGSDASACAEELENFANIVDLCARLRDQRPDRTILMHLISSAGGVYEGSGEVAPGTPFAPRRPYGELKLAQESLARARLGGDALAIYRPSAVFGWTRHGRRGLVLTLLANGLGYRVSTIIGRPDSARDFLWVRDLATWMLGGLHDRQRIAHASILAAGRSLAMREVLRSVEQTLGRRLYVQYRVDPREPRYLGYRPSVIAPGLVSHSLPVALRSMWVDAAGSP